MYAPISTWTNLAFLFPAAFAFSRSPLTAKIFGVTCICLCLASGLFHYTYKHELCSLKDWFYWQNWDERTMYTCLSFAIAYLFFLLGVSSLVVIIAAVIITTIMSLLYNKIRSFVGVPILIGTLLVPALILNTVLALVATGIIIIAFLIRQEAERRGGKIEDVGHGVWHIFGSGALSLIMLF